MIILRKLYTIPLIVMDKLRYWRSVLEKEERSNVVESILCIMNILESSNNVVVDDFNDKSEDSEEHSDEEYDSESDIDIYSESDSEGESEIDNEYEYEYEDFGLNGVKGIDNTIIPEININREILITNMFNKCNISKTRQGTILKIIREWDNEFNQSILTNININNNLYDMLRKHL